MTPNERGQTPQNGLQSGLKMQNDLIIQNDAKMQSDATIEVLLTEFFANEMPAELRELAHGHQPDLQRHNRPQLVAVSVVATDGNQRRAGWLGLSVVAASLLTVAVLLSQPTAPTAGVADSTANAPELKQSVGGVASTDSVAPTESTKPNVKISVTEDFNDVERYDTTIGPVEQRSKLRIKNVTIFDPETGAAVELLPELEIDIFPIEDE